MFQYDRVVHFQETDAAGVVYFTHVLAMCHEAYEASLQASGIKLREFFHSQGIFAVPIVHSTVDFKQPLFCGDHLQIQLIPTVLTKHSFEIHYRVFSVSQEPAAIALTRHVCIDPRQRSRQPLPPELQHWLHQWADHGVK